MAGNEITSGAVKYPGSRPYPEPGKPFRNDIEQVGGQDQSTHCYQQSDWLKAQYQTEIAPYILIMLTKPTQTICRTSPVRSRDGDAESGRIIGVRVSDTNAK